MTAEPSPILALLRWLTWWTLLAILTWGLVSPVPQQINSAVLPESMNFTASKAVHISAYAFLTVLVAWLPATLRQRAALWLVLVCHAALTEYLQTFVPLRVGCLSDVGINLVGIALGVGLACLADRQGWTTPRLAANSPFPTPATAPPPQG